MIKKLWLSLIAWVFALSASFAAYSPSMDESKKVDAAWAALLQIIEVKHDGNYDLLLWLLKSFQAKVAGDERKVWILDTLIALTMDKMGMMMKDDEMMDDKMNDEMMEDDMMDTPTNIELMPLENVTDQNPLVRWVQFNGTEMWSASIQLDENGDTFVYAEFDVLPDPGADNFYEGWIVRQTWWFNFYSTGELEVKDGKWINTWTGEWDLTDHTFYVLTLEPNDNDPAPAEHVLEAHVR